MSAIYRPKGRALEYGGWALNLFRGCPYGCLYCYAPRALRMDRQEFHREATPRLTVLKRLKEGAAKRTGEKIFLCFSCDPYPEKDEYLMAREAIKLIHSGGAFVRILTKSGLRAARDFDLLSPRDEFGVTLTYGFLNAARIWEPNAAPPEERIESLKAAHKLGVTTWVSLEPVISPTAAIEIIYKTHEFVDSYKIGKWEHDERATAIDWVEFVHEAKDLLDKLGKKYLIKKRLAKYLEEVKG